MNNFNIILPSYSSLLLKFDDMVGPFNIANHSNMYFVDLSINSPLFFNLDKQALLLLSGNSALVVDCLKNSFNSFNKRVIFLSNCDLGMAKYISVKFGIDDLHKYVNHLKAVTKCPDPEFFDIMSTLYNNNAVEDIKTRNIPFPLTFELLLEYLIEEYPDEFNNT